jgi:serine/threonine protein kinase
MRDTILKDDHISWTVLSVYKRVHPYYYISHQMDCYTNEKQWLTELQPSGIVPQLLMTLDDTQALVTEYVGEPVTAATLPADWQSQRDHILEVLCQYNCRHNDIKPSEILVHAGTLRLVDFGWASPLDQPIPIHYPYNLGGKWRCPTGLDDRYSFDAAVQTVMGKMIRP